MKTFGEYVSSSLKYNLFLLKADLIKRSDKQILDKSRNLEKDMSSDAINCLRVKFDCSWIFNWLTTNIFN